MLSLIAFHPELLTSTLACVSVRNPWICIYRLTPLRFVPLGMFTAADTVVPFGPITSNGRVTFVVLGGGVLAAGVKLTVAAPVLLLSAELVAITVTVCALLIVAGAVYTPFTSVPTEGFINQITPLLLVPVTEALKVVDAPAPSDTEDGAIVTPTCVKDTVELSVLVGSAALVAVIVTVCGVPTIAGA